MRRERAAELTEAERERYGRQMLIANWGAEAHMNPHVRIEALSVRIETGNVDDLVADADIIVDCMDNEVAVRRDPACAVCGAR